MNISLIQRQIGSLPPRMTEAEDRLDSCDKKIEELMEKLKNMPAGGGADANLLNDYLKRLEKCEKKAEKAEDKAEKGLKKIKKWKPQWK